ncbi:carbohydrate kinase family protein [Paenibacillus marinisediminis]
MKRYDAVVIGDANIDLVVGGSTTMPSPGEEIFVDMMQIHVGGGAALFSLSLAKLGMKLAFNGVLGKDQFGEFILDEFKQTGIDTRQIKRSEMNNTGISIAVNPQKDRSFITYMGSNQEVNLDQVDLLEITQGRHIHLTGYKGRQNHETFIALVKKLKAEGITLSCDTGWDDTGEWYQGVMELMTYMDVFFMNEQEALHYTRTSNILDSIEVLRKYSKHFVLKLGAKGAVACVQGELTYRSGFIVDAVDTTGAGDSFNAGYMYGFLSDKPVEKGLMYGNACGSFSVRSYGGSTGTPNLETLEQYIADHHHTILHQMEVQA